MPDLKDYISTEDAARTLQFHPDTIRFCLRHKTLEGIKVGRTWLVSKASIQAYKNKTAGKAKHDPWRRKLPA